MFRDVSTSLFRRPATVQYPAERKEAPQRLRGLLRWDPAKCTGCGLCAKDCPAEAIEVRVIDRKAKRFVFSYQSDRCAFCAQCVYSCRQGCLSMDHTQWELASLDREHFQRRQGEEANDGIGLANDLTENARISAQA
jgi:formate hydrogenlyase subunit 6/NADH:ubiquinone oxidoreductase subunit I